MPWALLLVAALPPARFEYRAPGLDDVCPSAEQMQQRIVLRLKQNPFDAEAARAARVTLERVGRGFTATFELIEPGSPPSSRRLASRSCRELADAVSLAVALALDPLAAPAVEPPPPQVEEQPAPPPLAAPPPEPSAFSGEVWVGPVAALGSAATVALGARVGAAARYRRWLSVGLEVTAAAGQQAETAYGPYSPVVAWGTLLGCGAWGFARACLGGSGGAFIARGARVEGGSSVAPTAAVDLRVGISLPLNDAFAFRAELEGAAHLVRPGVASGAQQVWSAPPVSGTLLVALVWLP